MLVLSRKKNESIMINGNIEIKIIESEDGKVRLGIEAPKEISIHRKEIFEKIIRENKAAVAQTAKMTSIKTSQLPKVKHYNKNIRIKSK